MKTSHERARFLTIGGLLLAGGLVVAHAIFFSDFTPLTASAGPTADEAMPITLSNSNFEQLSIADRDRDLFLAAGAHGHGAIYTAHGHHIHIVRKVILRVGSYLNYLILKLH